MSYVNKVISIYNTEPVFMKTFIRELTAADERIVCTTEDINTNFYNVSLKISNSCSITMGRAGEDSRSEVPRYFIWPYPRDSTLDSNYQIYTTNDNNWVYPDAIYLRSLSFTVASNDNALFISIKGTKNTAVYFLSVEFENFSAAMSSTNFSSLSTLCCTDLVNTKQLISMVNRLAYQDDGNGITNTIDSKVFTYALSNVKFAEVSTGLMDCSYMGSPNIISTNSGKFFTLNNYTLMPITEDNKGGE